MRNSMRVMSQRYSNMDCSMSLHKRKTKMTLTSDLHQTNLSSKSEGQVMQATPTDTPNQRPVFKKTRHTIQIGWFTVSWHANNSLLFVIAMRPTISPDAILKQRKGEGVVRRIQKLTKYHSLYTQTYTQMTAVKLIMQIEETMSPPPLGIKMAQRCHYHHQLACVW